MAAENRNKLVLNHMFLYSKGWYKYTKNIWEGYRRAILCDGHYHPMCLRDVAHIMYKYLIMNKEAIIGKRDDMDFYIQYEIRHALEELTTYELYRKCFNDMTPLEWYDMAVVWACHCFFQNTDSKIFDVKFIPSRRVMPLGDKHPDKSNKEMYEYALSMFGKDAKPYDVNDECSMHMWKYIKKDYSVKEEIESGKLIYA